MSASKNARKDSGFRDSLGAERTHLMRSLFGIWVVALVNSTGCSPTSDEPRVEPDETTEGRDASVLDSENGAHSDTIAEFDSAIDAAADTTVEDDAFDGAEALDGDAFDALDVDVAADSGLEDVEAEVDGTTTEGDSSVVSQDGSDTVPEAPDTSSDVSETGVDGLDSGQQPNFDYLIPILLEILDDD